MDRWMVVIQFHYQCGSCLICKQWYQHDKHTICKPSKLPSKYFIIVWQRGDGAVYCCFTALYKQKIGQSVCQLVPKSSSALINVTSQRGVRAFDLIASSLFFENVFKRGPLVDQQEHNTCKAEGWTKKTLVWKQLAPRRRPQPDLKFVTKSWDTFQLVQLKNCEKTFECSWFFLNVWKHSFHDIDRNLSKLIVAKFTPPLPQKPIHHSNIAKVFLQQSNFVSTFLAWVGFDKCRVEAELVRDWSVSAPAPAHRSPSWWSEGSAWFGCSWSILSAESAELVSWAWSILLLDHLG